MQYFLIIMNFKIKKNKNKNESLLYNSRTNNDKNNNLHSYLYSLHFIEIITSVGFCKAKRDEYGLLTSINTSSGRTLQLILFKSAASFNCLLSHLKHTYFWITKYHRQYLLKLFRVHTCLRRRLKRWRKKWTQWKLLVHTTLCRRHLSIKKTNIVLEFWKLFINLVTNKW